ncbi:MAG: hypothetical protein ACR2I2_23970 [Bryobacteraceae bacterium]
MKTRLPIVSAAILLSSIAAFAQNPITVDPPFQVRYASNPIVGDSVVNITNTGASSAGFSFLTQNGDICVKVYTFSSDGRSATSGTGTTSATAGTGGLGGSKSGV